MLQQTSMFNYDQYVRPTLSRRQHEVLAVIRQYQPVCGREIAEILEMEFHQVSGRITELKDPNYSKYGGPYIKEDLPRRAYKGKTVMWWRIK